MSSNPVNSQNMKLEVVVLPVSDVDHSQDLYKTLGCSNASANPYQAVSCSFYDELEALATLHRICTIHYRTETGEAVSIESQIIDLYTANKSEFLQLKDGTEIRLDRLISVDGKPSPLQTIKSSRCPSMTTKELSYFLASFWRFLCN